MSANFGKLIRHDEDLLLLMVPALCVGTRPGTLCVPKRRSAAGCIPTQSMGTMSANFGKLIRNDEDLFPLMVPTLCVGTRPGTLCVPKRRSAAGCIPTQSMGTMSANFGKPVRNDEDLLPLMVPALCVGTRPGTLCVPKRRSASGCIPTQSMGAMGANSMVRHARHERNQTLAVRPEPVEGLIMNGIWRGSGRIGIWNAQLGFVSL